MSCFPPPPDKEAFEKELSSIFGNGDQDKLARFLKVRSSYVSKCLNPHLPDESIQYRQVWWQWAADCISLDKGDRMFAMLERDYQSRRVDRMVLINSAAATRNIGIQFMEFVEAELAGLPADVQLRELEDIERAVSEKKLSLLARRQRQYS